ncbi:unnamed protein product [Dovyalis caffra]|uniref:Uncharacterized protein n=1 Tax=Dovyalis caffra TaxID=77055 RepID=A0AAV1QQN0_9ROSI|nr:unnamed protein product [Dovyalis caffra]
MTDLVEEYGAYVLLLQVNHLTWLSVDLDNTLEMDAACEKDQRPSRAKELGSSLIVSTNSALAAAKESASVKMRTPKELDKWIELMFDVYHLNKEDSDNKEAKQMPQPAIIRSLFILKETIEEENFGEDYISDATRREH